MGRHRESPANRAPGERPSGALTDDEKPDPRLRIGVVVQTLLFGLVGIGTTFTQDGPTEGLGTVLTYAVCITTIPVAWTMSKADFGMDWWSRRAPVNNWFVVYCELGVTTVTATHADPLALFTAKRNGRNRIALARPHIAESPNREYEGDRGGGAGR
ncbi:PKD domain containing protein [Rhodococcus sp. AW25M09]|uniref:hypothetical protein n=1 Tax=Rhodococcus sp. AW25M09 TaxID=1268303 RepID=UPI0002AC5C2D|nr:hypothetical protein [Rhodococcus sp. AW25M09]CCQ17485.1 PKD domain containing protein [Rhodococcus sp. AW25M09]